MNQDIFENAWHNVRGVSEEELQGDPEVLRKYGDILETDWTGVRFHTQADLSVRAAQFSPFAALSGYDGEIKETARLTAHREELTEERKRELDETLGLLKAALQGSSIGSDASYKGSDSAAAPKIRVTYFLEDLFKEGGEYLTLEAQVKKVDTYTRKLQLWTENLQVLSHGPASEKLYEQIEGVQSKARENNTFSSLDKNGGHGGKRDDASILTISVNDISEIEILDQTGEYDS